MQETTDIIVRPVEQVARFYLGMVQRHQVAAFDRRPLIEQLSPDAVYVNDHLVWSEEDVHAQT